MGRFVALMAGVLGLVLGLGVGLRIAATPAMDLSKLNYSLVVSEGDLSETARWSPDGKALVYADTTHLWVQSLETAAPSPIFPVNLLQFVAPFFSLDGSKIYFSDARNHRSVWLVGAAGGEPQAVLQNLGGFSPHISQD